MRKKSSKFIYLDHAATTPMASQVIKVMESLQKEIFGNPTSPHFIGRKAQAVVDQARKTVANFLGTSHSEIIFTSGATESNNLAIRGVVKTYQEVVKHPEIITSPVEHHSVLETCKDLEKEGVKIIYLPVNQEGLVKINHLEKLITPDTVLITIMYVNNEIGTIEPIKTIGKTINLINQEKLKNKKQSLPILFHTDAVQAVPFLNCQVDYLGVDLLSFSGHKINGPKGVGVLFKRKGIPFLKIQTGGDQEYNFRAGTQNVPGIVGLGKAIELCQKSQRSYYKKMNQLQAWLITQLEKARTELKLTGPRGKLRIPNNVHVRVNGVLGEELMFLFDQKAQIAVSTASACTAGATRISSVLLALGLSEQEAKEGLRITMGKTTTETDLKKFIFFFKKFVNELKNNSRKDLLLSK